MNKKDRKAWLEKRRHYIGASDAAAALGQSPWKSQYELCLEKRGMIEPDDISDKEFVYWGNAHEPAIRTRVGELFGASVMHDGPTAILVSDDHPWMSCTLDGQIVATNEVRELFANHGLTEPDEGSIGTVQAKTTAEWNSKSFADDWPVHYKIQCMHELVVSGCKWGLLAALIGGNKLKVFPFNMDKRFCGNLVVQEERFWNIVQGEEEPEVDGSLSTARALKKMYPEDDGEVVTLPDELIEWDKVLELAKHDIKVAKLKEATAKAHIIEAIGSATVGELLGGGCDYSYIVQTRNTIDAEALRFDYPKIAREVTIESTSRVLRRRVVVPG